MMLARKYRYLLALARAEAAYHLSPLTLSAAISKPSSALP
jgi:hypothetical protein